MAVSGGTSEGGIPGGVGSAVGVAGGLRFRMLGTVEGDLDGRPLRLGPPQQRALLAVLLLREGRPVSMPELLDAIWGERLPPRGVGTLRTYVSRLRTLLEPGRPSRTPARLLVSADDGYALRVPAAALDTVVFETRLAEAARLRGAGDTEAAHRELTGALALWGGSPLAGLPGPHAERERDRLTELWLSAREDHFHGALALDRHAATIASLRAFAAEHPLRERTQALLMLALHRAGRQADAFAVYEATRRTLDAELGVPPGPELTALHTRLLTRPPRGHRPSGTPGSAGGLRPGAPRVPEGARAARTPPRALGGPGAPRSAGEARRAGEDHSSGAPRRQDAPLPSEGTRPGSRTPLPPPGGAVPQEPIPAWEFRRSAAPRPAAAPRQDAASRPAGAPGPVDVAEDGQRGVHPRPSQLPPAIADFTGRVGFLGEVSDLLQEASDGRFTGVGVLTGLGGVGKSALAVRAGHRMRRAFPDGQLYVDLRGSDAEPADSADVLAHLLHSLGVAEEAVPDDVAQRGALYRSLLAGRHVLVLLDNAHDTAQLRPLLPGTPGSAVLVTSRTRIVGLPGARIVDVEAMSEQDALSMLETIVGAERVRAEPEAARRLVASCGRLPLAVRIAASRLTARSDWAVADLTARLRDERHRLDELEADGLGVDAAFRLSYEGLAGPAARAFRLTAAAAVPVFGRATAAALLDADEYAAEEALEALVDAGLLEACGVDRYRFHDLVRIFARRVLDASPDAAERPAAQRRLLDHVLATVRNTVRCLRPLSRVPDLLYAPQAPGYRPADAEAARAWLQESHQLIRDTAEQALGKGPWEELGADALRPAVDLLTGWAHLVLGTARRGELHGPARLALSVAHRHGDSRSAGRALRLIAVVPQQNGDTYRRIERTLREALRCAALACDPLTEAEAAHELAVILAAMGRPADALPLFEQAYARFVELGSKGEAVRVLAHVVRAHMLLGHKERAESAASEVLRTARELGDRGTLGHVLYQIGCALLAGGRPVRAAAHLRESRQHHQWVGDLRWEAMAWARLAHCALARERPGEAAACATQALSIEGDLGDPFCRGLALAARGRALLALGETPALSALASLRTAHRLLSTRGAAEADELTSLLRAVPPVPGQPSGPRGSVSGGATSAARAAL
ncbi:BTAD domain-containing putative transcriptional regulator [Streptomyces sp. NBC_00083]|uniref:AfsR/SARP family transcriptional regulator n=1 Tax=Streptomyces sp. NBC_00083 TaxID=2975647 RepID=UPI00224D4E8B|nr:BTAD domain-containing putative transcriptional regulator [Streptomyces sp. NBC_00083]MCX5388272.1 NB-ARC domain-containing protein [Streptomyces sp. NBC_00083]